MSNMLRPSQLNQLDSLELQIDRLNNRISQFVNTSICSESESEDHFLGHHKGQSSIDLSSPLKVITMPMNEE